jgi:hypothetical protein
VLRDRFQVVEIPITALNREAVKDLAIGAREGDRSKNFFALGLMYWLYNRRSSRRCAGSSRASRATCSRRTSAC